MPHVIWHCNGVGHRLRREPRQVAFFKGGTSFFEWTPSDGMSARAIAKVNRSLSKRRDKQIAIIAKATGLEANETGVGPFDYAADVGDFPIYKNGMSTYNWLPSHDMPRAKVLRIDAKLEKLRQEQLKIIAKATGGEIYGDGSMHEGRGRYPHNDL